MATENSALTGHSGQSSVLRIRAVNQVNLRMELQVGILIYDSAVAEA